MPAAPRGTCEESSSANLKQYLRHSTKRRKVFGNGSEAGIPLQWQARDREGYRGGRDKLFPHSSLRADASQGEDRRHGRQHDGTRPECCRIYQFEVFVGDPHWLWGLALIGPWLAHPLIWRLYRVLLRKETEIIITPEEFRFRSWKGWRTYDRQLPHKFALIPHDKARAEKEAHDLETRREQARGQFVSKTRYYGESYHLSFEYLGQRNDVLTIHGRKEALAVLARLKACDEVMDAEARMGDGIALDPEDQWSDQPGEIK